MNKALWILAAVLVALLLAFKPLLNFSPLALPAAFNVATGLGAKLACSAHYITGLDDAQVKADLASYSPAFGLVDLTHDPSARSVSATLFGLAERSARFRPGLGCTQEFPGSEKLDVVTIAQPGPAMVANWPAGSGSADIDPALQAALGTLLEQDNSEGYQTRALVLVRDGKLVAESYAPPFDETTPHLGWSMGKSLTALLIGRLATIAEVDESATDLFDAWGQDGRRAISLVNLLHMSSGLAFEEDYTPGTDATYMLSASPSAASVAMGQPLDFPLGQHFAYSSGTTNLLALWLQQALGGTTQAAVDHLRRELLFPSGAHSTVLEPDASGVLVGSSFAYASGRDWARLGQLMLADGTLNGRQLISRDWVARARSPNTALNDSRYGYQFWLNAGARGETLRWPELPEDAYAMMGNRGQVVMIIPSEATVIVRLGWSAMHYPESRKFAGLLEVGSSG